MVMDPFREIERLEHQINQLNDRVKDYHSARQNDIILLHCLIKRLGGEVTFTGDELVSAPKNEAVQVTTDMKSGTFTFKIIKTKPMEYDKDGKPILKV